MASKLLLGAGRLPKRLAAAPARDPRLVENLDEETARRAKVERPAPVEFMGRLHLEAVGLQPLEERVHLPPAILPEADVKGPRVDDLLRLGEVGQAQKNARVCGTLQAVPYLAPLRR